MTDKTRAMLGDYEAAERLTEAGIAIPCPFCANRIISRCEYNGLYVYTCSSCGTSGDIEIGRRKALLSWNTRTPILSESELKNLCKGGEED